MANRIGSDEIRTTLYNTLLNVAINRGITPDLNSPLPHFRLPSGVVDTLLLETIQQIRDNGFITLNGTRVTHENVPAEFEDLYQAIVVRHVPFQQLLPMIKQKPVFQSMLKQLVEFYLESQGGGPSASRSRPSSIEAVINEETIRTTFYNIMFEEVYFNGLISRDALESRDAFIYLAMSSYAILTTIMENLHRTTTNGILLYNGAVVTETNCPVAYRPLFASLIKAKAAARQLRPNPQQIHLIKLYSTGDADLVIPAELERLKTPQLMELIALINSIAIRISQVGHFKDIIDAVIIFCLDAIKARDGT